jgi:hypothetical protein
MIRALSIGTLRDRLRGTLPKVPSSELVTETFLASELGKLREELDERFTRIDERFTRNDERFAGIDARFAGIDARFDRLEARFDGLEARFDRQQREITLMFAHQTETLLAEMSRLTTVAIESARDF